MAGPGAGLLGTLDTWSSRPLSILGVSAARAVLGLVGFMYYVSQYADRHYLFGPEGVLPHDEFLHELRESGTFSLYAWSSSPAWAEFVFHAGALAALAVLLGIGGRAGLALHWLFLWSLYQRQSALLDGGDNLAYLVIPMLLLTRCYDRLALSTGLSRRLTRHFPGSVRALEAPLHNLGVLAITAQICLVYMVSGLYKVHGQVWQDGTALFYILRVPEFTQPGLSNLVYDNDLLVYLGTYGSVLFQVYFPLGILVPRLRPWAAAASIAFHLSIALLMGLTSFALTMIACDLVFLTGPLEKTLTLCRRVHERLRQNREDRHHEGGGPHQEESGSESESALARRRGRERSPGERTTSTPGN
ncbi:HTTM domain-containing protein [Streptomyces sp. NBC_01795]|uniref:HTTM domain-containing protein n=1 Tax=unclassified Streptomyces TaxID=2593676 RepID=UPI002DDA6F95|nr:MULTISPECIES: HTTM domain-containing protein [unclassified Streptomyces]WSA90688.1 HTTM domain-containing protein [Streptomyces sp. NBC_01795]WSB75013.1 HTTM domain-containing protein [Streptomyces sp. NBC_01775]WSS16708.1 HTTM domain-containing protein [Streptomyces sp. NBC_01186]